MRRTLPRFLWWLRPNTFQAVDGTAVVFVDHEHIRYYEGERSVLIDQELQADPHLVGIYRSSIAAWDVPHKREPLESSDQDRIIENMRLAFQTQNYSLTVLPE
jgi:hypothetical protein